MRISSASSMLAKARRKHKPKSMATVPNKAKGGIARAEALTPQQRQEIARLGAQAKWDKEKGIPQARHEGTLKIGDTTIPCAVLEDGTRVLTQSGMMLALGRARQAKGRSHYDGDVNLPAFLTAKNLKPFVSKELEVTSSQVEFRLPTGMKAFGYRAELLPEVCDVYVKARNAGALTANQIHIADKCEILRSGLGQIGIIGLIDEATGFQYVRDKLALQEILDAYLRRELAAWAQRFPEEFYRQIFRLRGWEWRGMQVNRPQVVAHYTNDFVYERIAPGLLTELKSRMPKTDEGRSKGRYHQLFTDDVGHPALAQHLHAVVALMRAARSWEDFRRLINAALPKKGENLEFDLHVEED